MEKQNTEIRIQKLAEAATDVFFAEIHRIAQRKKEELAKPSPYRVHRDKIFAHYSTAYRLQDLILHLYNDINYTCNLASLLANADMKHTELAIDIIRRYSILGENDRDFMATAEELQARRAAA